MSLTMISGCIITRSANGGYEHFVTSMAPQVRDAAGLGTATEAIRAWLCAKLVRMEVLDVPELCGKRVSRRIMLDL